MFQSLIFAALLPLAAVALGQDEDAERAELEGALAAFHTALQEGEPSRAAERLAPSLFMADESSGSGPGRVSAHLFLAGDELRDWPEAFLSEAGPYRNAFRVVSVSVRGDAAVVVTRDTGSNRFRSWSDEEVVWFLGRVAGSWRIAAMIVRDIQLPPRE